jgi:hypothetical protein
MSTRTLKDWAAALTIAIGLAYMAASETYGISDMQSLIDAEAAHTDAQRQAVMNANRAWAAKQACPGGIASWEDDTTLVCKARKGKTQQSISVAEL